MIQTGELIRAGQIFKPHGLKGELSFGLSNSTLDADSNFFIFLMVDGIPVPFYVTSVRMKSDETGLMMLDGVETEEQARELAGLDLYLHPNQVVDSSDDEMAVEMLVGYTLTEEQAGVVGVISSIDTTTENTLFVIEAGDDEILIPVVEEYIISIDQDQKIIEMSLPEGLLSL
jgi:16S rRNA processing protein RimM